MIDWHHITRGRENGAKVQKMWLWAVKKIGKEAGQGIPLQRARCNYREGDNLTRRALTKIYLTWFYVQGDSCKTAKCHALQLFLTLAFFGRCQNLFLQEALSKCKNLGNYILEPVMLENCHTLQNKPENLTNVRNLSQPWHWVETIS